VQSPLQRAAAVDVIAAGKAAAVMLEAFAQGSSVPVRTMLGIGPQRPASLPSGAVWQDAGHPLPSDGSVAGARRALDIGS
jgi:glycerate-2-kinase